MSPQRYVVGVSTECCWGGLTCRRQIRVEEVPAIAIIRARLSQISEEIKVDEAGQDFDSGDYFIRLFTVEFPGLNQTVGWLLLSSIDGYRVGFHSTMKLPRRASSGVDATGCRPLVQNRRVDYALPAASVIVQLGFSNGRWDGGRGTTIRSIGHVARLKRIADNDADFVEPLDMLGEIRDDNRALITRMIEIHDLCNQANDVATASLLETWIDETQRRVWFLFETSRTELAS
jgi:ferritin-like protein